MVRAASSESVARWYGFHSLAAGTGAPSCGPGPAREQSPESNRPHPLDDESLPPLPSDHLDLPEHPLLGVDRRRCHRPPAPPLRKRGGESSCVTGDNRQSRRSKSNGGQGFEPLTRVEVEGALPAEPGDQRLDGRRYGRAEARPSARRLITAMAAIVTVDRRV